MSNLKNSLTLDQLFAEALNEAGADISEGGLRLLTSGFTALCAAQEQRLNEIELKSISGMISYVSYCQEVNEVTVCEILTANFGVTDTKSLPARLYQNAIEFLVDLQVANAIN